MVQYMPSGGKDPRSRVDTLPIGHIDLGIYIHSIHFCALERNEESWTRFQHQVP